ncbi:hypothetical protein K461DRAFT_282794 [Myriangium duriaei CBS 260.36]|uniref:Uncharacterized protein n=1 Tax=Myriangium duriaei CBS 260.36 TaxID=1168546 RepID=A0A9P4ITZ7_9PEZI|nr:hypothetical protein K461DRAFT_282794 [Myriangium duriaei CBS 260.36]
MHFGSSFRTAFLAVILCAGHVSSHTHNKSGLANPSNRDTPHQTLEARGHVREPTDLLGSSPLKKLPPDLGPGPALWSPSEIDPVLNSQGITAIDFATPTAPNPDNFLGMKPSWILEETLDTVGPEIADSIGADLVASMAAEVGGALGPEGAAVASEFLTSIAADAGVTLAAETGVEVGAEAGSAVAGEGLGFLLPELMSLVNPILLAAEVAVLPYFLADIITNSVHHHLGKCHDNVCVTDKDGKEHECSEHFPCDVQGQTCGHRSIHPQKTVCQWDKYRIWKKATGMSSLEMGRHESKASHKRKHAEKHKKKLEGLYQELDQCNNNHDDCHKIEKDIRHHYDYMVKDLEWADQYKNPDGIRKAKKYYNDAIHFAQKHVKHHVVDLRHAQTDLAWADYYHDKHDRRKAKSRIQYAQYHVNNKMDLLTGKIRKAQNKALEADPFAVLGIGQGVNKGAMTKDEKVQYLRDAFHKARTGNGTSRRPR